MADLNLLFGEQVMYSLYKQEGQTPLINPDAVLLVRSN